MWWQEDKCFRPYLLMSYEQYYAWLFLPWTHMAAFNLFYFFYVFCFCQCCCPFSMDWYFCFHWWSVMKWWNQFYHHNISGYEAILSQTSADEIYEHSVRFEVWMMSGYFRLKISLGVSFVSVCCVGFNQECYVSIQYSLLKDCCERFLI